MALSKGLNAEPIKHRRFDVFQIRKTKLYSLSIVPLALALLLLINAPSQHRELEMTWFVATRNSWTGSRQESMSREKMHYAYEL